MQPYLGKQEEEQLLQVAPMGQEVFSSVRYTVLQHLGVLLERLGWGV